MSRKRNRIAAVTIMTVAVFGLGFAGYIQATRASGRDTNAGYVDGTGFHRYQLNHQIGTGGGAHAWSVANQYANNFEEGSTQLANNESAGSNEPENGDDADAENTGTTHADGAGAGPGANSDVPAGAPPAAGGDGNQAPSTLRLAGTFGSGYSGGSSGGNAQGGAAPPSNSQTGNDQPGGNTNPPTDKTDKPASSKPSDETGPGPQGPGPEDESGPKDPPPDVYVPDPPAKDPVSVPEPATLGLLGFGVAAMAFMRRRRGTAS